MKITTYTMYMDEDKHPYLVQEANHEYTEEQFNSPQKISEMLNAVFRMKDLSEEYVYMICFDNRYVPTAVFELSHGSATMSLVGIREVFQRAVLSGALSFAIAHNHPSGWVFPSDEDISIFGKLREAGDLMGIPLTDFMIIGRCGYYSFRNEGHYSN
ncbi:JAB domain-containing protein [Bilifractor sp. LCP19S3_H10]|uniref:JAB domain-containing protein n=1 Tax=Bilifractor sp. LCP19S3_H10 TaxID=3438736 RepID=UPI003F90466C